MRVTTGLLLLAFSMSAFSQPATPPATNGGSTASTTQSTQASSDTSLQEVEVTATRQVEAESKVPISLSVYTDEALQVRGFRDASDMMLMTPGIYYQPSGFLDSNSVSIRGITSGAGQSTVGIYIDDTPIQIQSLGYDPASTFPKLFDLDRVEVLRGPQGTLFGASSEGGTLRFITPQPSLTQWSSYERVEFGQIDDYGQNYEVGAAVGGPIIDDTLGFRFSAYYRHDGGWIDRYNELSDQELESNSNYSNDYVLRGALAWAPIEHLVITPSIMYQRTNLNDQDAYWEQISNPSQNIYRSMDPLPSPEPDYFFLPAVKIDYTNPYFEVVSNTSYFNRIDYPTADYSLNDPSIFAGTGIYPGIPNYRAYSQYLDAFHTIVEDARIQSDPNAKLKWTFGVYYNDTKDVADEFITDLDFAQLIYDLDGGGTLQQDTGVPLLDNRYIYMQYFYAQNRELASYGELGYEVLPGVRVTVGTRVSRILLWNSNYVTGAFNFGTDQGIVSSTEHAVTPKYNISWQIDDASMVYATADKGFRPGGANVAINSAACLPELHSEGFATAPITYNPDSLWNYEVGTKNRLLGGSMEVEGSLFHINWTNIQQQIYLADCGLEFNSNLGQAVSKGFDFTLNQRVGSFLYLAQIGYTDAYFSKTLDINPGSLPLVRTGDALQEKPWTISIGAQYNFDILQHGSFARVDWADQSGFRALPINDPATSTFSLNERIITSYSYFNLRVGTNIGHMQLSAFANNMFNDRPVLSGYTEGGLSYFEDVTLAPRTIGITAEFRY